MWLCTRASRGRWSHPGQLAKRARVLPVAVAALAASLEVHSFARKLRPRVLSRSSFGLESRLLNLADGGSNGSEGQEGWGFELSRIVCPEARH